MNLIIDIGNSNTKLAVFDGHTKISSFRTKLYNCAKIEEILTPHNIAKAIVCSVRDIPDFIYDLLTLNIPFTHKLTDKSRLPFKIKYETPETLGPDRIAAVAGAWYHYPDEKVLVIDAGSAVTFDYLDGKSYLGGNISPGLSMRFKALHKFTSHLPLASTVEKYSSPGKNTLEAITAGVTDGLIFEILEYIKRFRTKNQGVKVIITGGDGGFLRERIGSGIDFFPDLVMEGLNEILILNEGKI
jgi:type III pantothenate kinase